MARPATLDIAGRIQKLLDERQALVLALATIDQTLEQVGSALHVTARRGRPGRKPGWSPASTSTQAGEPIPGAPVRRRRRRGRYATSGDDSILNFVREAKNPTTQEVKRHWISEGRGGTADNVLTKLVKAKLLKRESLEGERGSRYSIA